MIDITSWQYEFTAHSGISFKLLMNLLELINTLYHLGTGEFILSAAL
jgi:hypothetical protein